METNNVTHGRVQTAGNAELSPAFIRQIGAALAAGDTGRTWSLIDRAGVSEPLLVARALTARDKIAFLGRLLKVLPVSQRTELQEVIASLLEGRQPSIAPAKTVSETVATAWQAEDAQAFLAAITATQANVPGVLIAAIDAQALQLHGLLFERQLTLLSLRFDHTKELSATSALHLRRDANTTVPRPEWERGEANADECPVLYAADFHSASSVFIKAKFSTNNLPTGPIEVRALEGGVLGTIDPFAVGFGQGTEVTVEVPLAHLSLYGPSQTDVSWRWEYRIGTGAWRFLAHTYHRVYCTPRRPNDPWILSEHDVANPWTTALDIACQANMSGSEDMDGLAASLCEVLNPGGLAPNPFRLAYSINDPGDANYNGPNGALDLSAFLERVGGGAGKGEWVNCDDCAGLVVTLANLLGCDLYEQYFTTAAMHPVMPLSEGQWWAFTVGFQPSFGPAEDGKLMYHRVAWRGNNADDAVVFDICWLLNAFGNPDDPEQPHPTLHSPWYPYGERFKIAGALDYIGRLHPTLGWSLGAKTRRGIS